MRVVGSANARGVLVLDDGSTFDLEGDVVVGRDPGSDARVVDGTARPVVLDDPDGTVSRVHAEVRFVDGHAELIDRGSTNGTHVWDETRLVWQRLIPGQPHPLPIGASGSFGPRIFVFRAAPDRAAGVPLLASDSGAIYTLDRAYVIGRDPLSDDAVRAGSASPIAVLDPHVSRVHAHVSLDGDRVFVRDAGTPNGTFVAAPGATAWDRVGSDPAELHSGGRVRVGTHVLTFRVEDGSTGTSSAAAWPAPTPGTAAAVALASTGADTAGDSATGTSTAVSHDHDDGGRHLPLPMALTRLMIRPPRAPLWCTPADVGLPYEDVAFEATDGVGIRGWFVPGAGGSSVPAPAIVFVHGWLWNRLGNVAGRVPFTDADVEFLPATKALHHAGYHVLLIDLSNHGESGARFPITYGPWEARDYAGALAYLRSRPDVDAGRLGAIGCSMGGNTILYGTPDCQPVRALLAIQPAVLPNFNRRFARDMLGPSGPAMVKSAEGLYLARRAPRPAKHNPAIPAARLGPTVVQYVQGTGDQWGSMEDVEAMVAATPNALPLVRFPSTGRYEGYRYVSEAVDDIVAFFSNYL